MKKSDSPTPDEKDTPDSKHSKPFDPYKKSLGGFARGATPAVVPSQADALSVLQDLLDWQKQWTSIHNEPFNWYGAIKSMLVMKEPRKPFMLLGEKPAEHNSKDPEAPAASASMPSAGLPTDDELDRILLSIMDDTPEYAVTSKLFLDARAELRACILAEVLKAKPLKKIQPEKPAIQYNEDALEGYNQGTDDYEASLIVRFGPTSGDSEVPS